MTEAWPDDVDVAQRGSLIVTMTALGYAICPVCLKPHPKAGHEHLIRPWSIPPRCTDCGSVLRMPEHQLAA